MTPIDLRLRYESPRDGVLKKQLAALEKHSRAFIALSPFLVIASAGSDGRVDASPRGDAPGFVSVIDDNTLAIPDRPGNNRLDTLENLVANPQVGMIFFVPGMSETLRVNGSAQISFDAALLEQLGFHGKPARSALVVTTHEVYFHCGRALIRAHLWDPEQHIDRKAFPTYGSFITDIRGGSAEDAAVVDRNLQEAYENDLF